jgi:hypothetical protein
VRRLPVLETIRQAYGFTFAHLGAIIGVIWLPMVIATVAGFFLNQHYAAEIQAATASGNAAAAGPAVLAMLFYLLAKLLLTAMMYVPVAQLALGQRQDGALLHFTFGALEWRMFRTLLGLLLFLAPPALLLMLVGQNVLAGAISGAAGPRLVGAELAFILLYAALVYVAVRIAALLVPVVVAGDKTALIRSWTLSGKSFWRLLGVMVGAVGPVMLTVAIVEVALLQAGGGDAALAATTSQITMANGPNAPLIAGLDFLMAPLLIGLSVSASVFAWKALSKTDLTV